MVLKVDHVSLSCDSEAELDRIVPKNYRILFSEEGLPNIKCKNRFLKFKSDYHNIILYGYDDTCIPIEITQYPCVQGINSDIRICDRTISWNVTDIDDSIRFFSVIGFNLVVKDNKRAILSLKPFLDKQPLRIDLIECKTTTADGFLDVNGVSSLGLFVDNVQKEADKFKNNGFFVSDLCELTVNHKPLSIAFVMGANLEIIELISVSRS